MNIINIIDLHCDTLYKAATQGISLCGNEVEVRLSRDKTTHKLQCYAIWLPDDLSEKQAEDLFFKSAKLLEEECRQNNIFLIKNNYSPTKALNENQNSAFFTVENAKALNGKLENISRFKELGVRMMTLTWNAANKIGGGADAASNAGLTDFGKIAVAKMEKDGIIIDISHASQALFYDVAENTNLPFVASHSNSYKITSHRRNLTDEQFSVIRNRKGLVGLNFHNEFLNNNSQNAGMTDILRHAEHFLSLGGEDILCFGSDFDGCTLPKNINNSEDFAKIYELFLANNYSESLIRKIFYENALNFFENFDNLRNM